MEAEDEILALQAHSEEIQKLINLFQSAAIRAIENHQPIQQNAQNKLHSIDDTILQPGTTIFLKAEGLLTKLEPRYRGPYTIHGQDSKGNYQVKNALGTLLKTVYPRHKIKIVPPDEVDNTTHVEVDKILDHRRSTSSSQFEYLVKWKDQPDTEKSHFDTLEIVNKYWASLSKRKPNFSVNFVTPINIILISLTFMLFGCGTCTAQISIVETLPFCDMSKTPTLIDIQKMMSMMCIYLIVCSISKMVPLVVIPDTKQ
jgi:hypothetical protein